MLSRVEHDFFSGPGFLKDDIKFVKTKNGSNPPLYE